MTFQSAPLMRGETVTKIASIARAIFQSTPLTRGETLGKGSNLNKGVISIHFPHTRGDHRAERRGQAARDFNPLPSCEGRPALRPAERKGGHFNPLPSCEGRHGRRADRRHVRRTFQSTPLMRGETCTRRLNIWWTAYFNPLPSHEGRRSSHRRHTRRQSISIRSPHTRGD